MAPEKVTEVVIVIRRHLIETMLVAGDGHVPAGAEARNDDPVQGRPFREWNVWCQSGKGERAQCQLAADRPVLQRERNPVSPIVELETITPEVRVDLAAGNVDVLRIEHIDISVPRRIAHQHRETRKLGAVPCTRAHVLGEAEVHQQVNVRSKDTEVVPFFMASRPTGGERRATEVVHSRDSTIDGRT